MHIFIYHNWGKTGLIKLAAVLFIAFLTSSCESTSEVAIVNESNDEISVILYLPFSLYDTVGFSKIDGNLNHFNLYNDKLEGYTDYKIVSKNFEGKPIAISFTIKPKSTTRLYSLLNGNAIKKQEDLDDRGMYNSGIADKLIIKLRHGGTIVADKEGVDKLFSHYEKSFLGGREAYRLVIN